MTVMTKTEIPLVDLKAQYRTIREEVRAAIDGVLDSMQLTIGPNVKAFDQEFAAFCGARHAIGVGSGTDALQLAIRALGISAGDEVITVSHTFVRDGRGGPVLRRAADPRGRGREDLQHGPRRRRRRRSRRARKRSCRSISTAGRST